MKKIFYLFIISLFFILGGRCVYATENSASIMEVKKPVICIEGNDYSKNLEYKGYEIIYNNVNYNLPGRYKIIYKNEDYDQIEKKVDVISKQSISDKSYYQIEETPMILNDYYQENVILTLENNGYLYVLYSLTDRDNDIEMIFLNIFENDKIIKHIEISNEVKINFVSILAYAENIVLVGSIKDKQYDYDLYYQILSEEGDLIDECQIVGNAADKVESAVIINDYIYIAGTTKSTTGYYVGNVDNDVFIFKIDLTIGIVRKTYVSKVLKVEYISNIVNIDENLYYGYSKMEDGFLMHYVRKMNLNFEVETELLIGGLINFEFVKFKVHKNNLYLLNQDYSNSLDKYISSLYIFNSDIRLINKKSYTYPGYDKVYATDLVVSEKGVVSILLRISDSDFNISYGIIKEYQNQEILNILQQGSGIYNCFINNDGNSLYKINGKKIYKVQINSVIVEKFGDKLIDKNTNVLNYKVMVNCEYLNVDLNYSSLEYDLNSFGTYRLVYGFNSKDLLFLYHLDIYVKDNINIIPKENYDINYELRFNGKGYLNGIEIPNRYVISEVGKYTLEVIGHDNSRIYYEFTISDNKFKIDYEDERKKLEDIRINEPLITNEIDIDLYQDLNQKIGNKDQNNWMLIIPGIVLITAVILIIKIH